MRRPLLRFFGIQRPMEAQRQRKALASIQGGMEYIVRRYGNVRPLDGSTHWYDR